MSMSRQNAAPRVPTPPRGEEIASYATYLEAQKAVDFLSDSKFAVELVTIVGADLKMVERVIGRLTYGRVALAGALSGAWFGLFVGLLLYIFSAGGAVVLTALAIGAGFGLLFSVLSYALTQGRRDFTSTSQIVASSYAILCASERAGEARQLLAQLPDAAGGVRSAGAAGGAGAPGAPAQPPANPTWGAPPAPQQPAQQQPAQQQPAQQQPATAPAPDQPAPERAPDPRWTTPTGEPRYGAMRPTSDTPPAEDERDRTPPPA